MTVIEMKNRIRTILRTLDQARRSDVFHPTDIRMKPFAYGEDSVMREDPAIWAVFPKDGTWGAPDSHFAFQVDIALPESFRGREAVVRVGTGATDIWNTDNPQMFAFINGRSICAMDMNHHEIPLRPILGEAETFRFGLHAYVNSRSATNFLEISVAVMHPEIEALYYDLKVPFEVASLLREDDLEALRTLQILSAAVNRLDLRKLGSEAFRESASACAAMLGEHFYSTSRSDEVECRCENAVVGNSGVYNGGLGLDNNRLDNSGNSADRPITVHGIGHTHIDVAWKWPLRQTREKTARSFSTVLHLMERYPEYRFMSSQPQLYQYVKEDHPELYERIRARIAEGRWETEGGMWLEADCNLTSGESLVRQILHGKAFFRDEFGTGDDEVLWLPDVFGYSAALPQILRRSGIRFFMTTKIGWNDTNRIPADTLEWEGIDGSRVLTHFITTTGYQSYPELVRRPTHNTTYNSLQNANHVMGTWQRYQNKDINRDVLTCFGYGDGGGGPTAAMLEENRRLEHGIPGAPGTRITGVREFFHLLERNLADKRVPKWAGELYLEFHRGTYTSMARIKKANRMSEFRNLDVEFFGCLSAALGAEFEYPAAELDRIWKKTLLNQFHDILPGSSIGEVYEDARRDHEEILSTGARLITTAQDAFLERLRPWGVEGSGQPASIVVFNTLGFQRDDLVVLEGTLPEMKRLAAAANGRPTQITHDGRLLMLAEGLPSKGYRVYCETCDTLSNDQTSDTACRIAEHEESAKCTMPSDVTHATPCASGFARTATVAASFVPSFSFHDNPEGGWTLASPHARIRLDRDANIVGYVAFPDGLAREIIPAGAKMNRLTAFEDRPAEYDAWNIDASFTERYWHLDALESIELLESGPVRMVVRIRRRFQESAIVQDLCLHAHTPRVDFRTTIDWNESQLLLKAAFPTELMTRKATCEIQYGHVERPTHRNTSWDQARFEVCAHKWVDLSEDGFGVALLNDARYGHDFEDAVMRLTLLKSGIFPYPEADRERHELVYSLLPHMGGFREGNVVREAYALNCPPMARVGLSKARVMNGLPKARVLNSLPMAQMPVGEAGRLESFSLVSADAANVMIEVVKRAEREEGRGTTTRDVIVRLYEAHGRYAPVTLDLSAFRPDAVWETDLLERPETIVECVDGKISFRIRPFKIRTFRIRCS